MCRRLLLEVPKTKILAPSEHIQIRVIALLFEIVEKNEVHDHEDHVIFHQGDDA